MTLVERLSNEVDAFIRLVKTKPVTATFIVVLLALLVFVLHGDKVLSSWSKITAPDVQVDVSPVNGDREPFYTEESDGEKSASYPNSYRTQVKMGIP